jgi:hypothetical protein
MLRPSQYDLRRAKQIDVVRTNVEDYLARTIVEGQPLDAIARVVYYYLGPSGIDAEEEVTEAYFLGRDDENPRQPGYYAVDVVTRQDDRSVLSKPWFAIHRDQSRDMAERRASSAEGGFQDVLEEYRILLERTKRELADQVRRNGVLQVEVDSFTTAIGQLRKANVAMEIEKDRAVSDAAQMEHKCQLAAARCAELEKEAASFKPQIREGVNALVERVGPDVQQLFLELAGVQGDVGGQRQRRPQPKPPWAKAKGKSQRADATDKRPDGTPAKERGGTAPDPQAATTIAGMPSPEELTAALHWLFWELEQFGKFVCFEQKAEDGKSPLCPWWVIRGIVYYHSGLDLGPDPIWPSDVAQQDQDGAAKPGGDRLDTVGSAAAAEIVDRPPPEADDAIDVTASTDESSVGENGDDGPSEDAREGDGRGDGRDDEPAHDDSSAPQ